MELLVKYHANTTIRISAMAPPAAPPAIAPMLEVSMLGVLVTSGGGVVGGFTGGGGMVTACAVKVGALVTAAVPALELLNLESLAFRVAVLIFATAAVAWFLLSMVTVVFTSTTLPLESSRLYTTGMEAVNS